MAASERGACAPLRLGMLLLALSGCSGSLAPANRLGDQRAEGPADVGSQDASPLVFVHVIPIEVAPGIDRRQLIAAESITAEIDAIDPGLIARSAPPGSVERAVPDAVVLRLVGYPAPADPPRPQDTRPSFVIDYDQASVAALAQSLRQAHGGRPPRPSEIAGFVEDLIPKQGGISRGWGVASQVAGRPGGDCTEHAVLSAALARAAGYPARVVVGTALIADRAGVGAYGHAWTEIYDGQRWQLLDATGIGAKVARIWYVRGAVLDEEGPGFNLDLTRKLRGSSIRKVRVLEIARGTD